MEPQWERLGEAVLNRRTSQGWTQDEVAERGGPSDSLQTEIESKRWKPKRGSKGTLKKIDIGMDWMEGSAADVLAGYDPTPVGGQPQPAPASRPTEGDIEERSEGWRYPEIKDLVQNDLWRTAEVLREEVVRNDCSPSVKRAAWAVISALSYTITELLISAERDGRLTPPQRTELIATLYQSRTSAYDEIGDSHAVETPETAGASAQGGPAQEALDDSKSSSSGVRRINAHFSRESLGIKEPDYRDKQGG